jgi:hypothetical protein
MVVRALLLTLILALTMATSAIAAPPTGGTGTPTDRTGGFGSIPVGTPAPRAAPVSAAGATAAPRAPQPHAAARAGHAQAHSSQSVVDVPLAKEKSPAPAATATTGQLPTTGFDLGLFTALGCLSAALGVGLLAALGPRRPA